MNVDELRPTLAEDVVPGDVIETADGLRKVHHIKHFEPYDSIQISCVGNLSVSTLKGRSHMVAPGVSV
jgi:hypothetical protein